MVDVPDNNGNDFIRGLETRACVNGITKTDALEIKKIPTLESETNEIKNTTIPALDGRVATLEQTTIPALDGRVTTLEQTTIPALDERVTALEQGGSGSEWVEIDVSTFTKAQEYINDIFYVDENDDVYLNYDIILYRYGDVKLFFKDTLMYDCFMEKMQMGVTSNPSIFDINSIYTELSYIFSIQPSENDRYLINRTKSLFDLSNFSFSFTQNDEEVTRSEIKILVKGYNPEENNEPNEPTEPNELTEPNEPAERNVPT